VRRNATPMGQLKNEYKNLIEAFHGDKTFGRSRTRWRIILPLVLVTIDGVWIAE
jgi:hypothetical protein